MYAIIIHTIMEKIRLLKYFKGYRAIAIFGAIFKCIEAIIQLFIPLSFARIIDEGIGVTPHNPDIIWKYSLIILACIIVSFGFSVCGQFFSSKAGAGVASNARLAMYEKISTFSFPELDKFGVASLNNRVTRDIDQLHQSISRFVRFILRIPTVVIGSLVVLFVIHWTLAIIIILAVPIVGAFLILIMYLLRKAIPLTASARDKVTKVTRENIKGAKIVRAFTNENHETGRFNFVHSEFERSVIHLSKITSLTQPVVSIIMGLALVILYVMGAIQLGNSAFTLGELPILTSYSHELVLVFVASVEFVIIIGSGRASWARIREVLIVQPTITNSINSIEFSFDSNSMIEFRNVSFSYDNSEYGVNNINLRIHSGESIGIIGPTGSGKTSLINLIPRFNDVTSGSIFINGTNIRDIELHSLRDNISFVSQIPDMLSGTIRTNLEFGKVHAQEELDLAIRISDATDIIKNKNDGIDEVVYADGKNFSLGQRQRLSLARAIAKDNQILILDDATSALDNITDALIYKELKLMPHRPTLIVVSQKIRTLLQMDRIILMDNGKISMIGSHDELLKKSSLYRKIAISQGYEGNK